jgi:VWFA-related protein
VSDLTREDFEVYEDGVKQQIASLTLSHGGRVTNVLAPPPPAVSEGIILPPTRRTNDTSGRIFVFFVDDLHLQFQHSPRIRSLLEKMGNTLLHEGDLFGMVSSGPSSISMQLTYDKKRFFQAIDRVTGDELKPSEIINGTAGMDGPSEVRHRARIAMDTVTELLENMEKVHDRRKSLIYVSDGYDFIPFQDSRFGLMQAGVPYLTSLRYRAIGELSKTGDPYATPEQNNTMGAEERAKETFSDSDLAVVLAELTRIANRANTTIYSIDPRGLVGFPDMDEPVDPRQWSAYIRKSQDGLRQLAEDTGGISVVNTNDFDKALKRIDAETSDYYVLGYYSSNNDPSRKLRRIEVRVRRPGIDVVSRKEYLLRPPPPQRRPERP